MVAGTSCDAARTVSSFVCAHKITQSPPLPRTARQTRETATRRSPPQVTAALLQGRVPSFRPPRAQAGQGGSRLGSASHRPARPGQAGLTSRPGACKVTLWELDQREPCAAAVQNCPAFFSVPVSGGGCCCLLHLLLLLVNPHGRFVLLLLLTCRPLFSLAPPEVRQRQTRPPGPNGVDGGRGTYMALCT